MASNRGGEATAQAPQAWSGTTDDLLARIDGGQRLASVIGGNRMFAPLEASVTSRFRGAEGRITLAHRDPRPSAALDAFDDLASQVGAATVDPIWRSLMNEVGAGSRERPIGCMASVRFTQGDVSIYPAAFIAGLAEHRTRLLSEALGRAGRSHLAALVTELDAAMSCGGANAFAPGLVGLRGEGQRAQARVYTASEFPQLSMQALGGPVAELLGAPSARDGLSQFARIAMDAHPNDPWSLVVSFELDDREGSPGRIKVYVRNPVIGPSDADAHARAMDLHVALGESPDPYLDLRERLGMAHVSASEPAFIALGISIDAKATTVDTYVFHPSHIARIAARAAGAPPAPLPTADGDSA